MKYYGVISGLPVLQVGKEPNPGIVDLRTMIEQFTDVEDAKTLELFYSKIDLINYNSIIQERETWIDGGLLDKNQLTKWVNSGTCDIHPFNQVEFSGSSDSVDHLSKLQKYWQKLYDASYLHVNQNIRRLINFEISYKNFLKSHLERTLADSLSEFYLEGGWFDRFAYRKLQIADIQAEHPYLAAVLQCLDISDPFERETALLEAKWQFYDYVSYFNRFDIEGIYAWLLKYLDIYRWSLNNTEKGQLILEKYRSDILERTQEQF